MQNTRIFCSSLFTITNNKYSDFNLSVYNIISDLRQLKGDRKILS